MSKQPVLSRKATNDVRAMVRKRLEQKPDMFSKTIVEAEIVKDHLMKAKVSLPEVGVSFTIFADEPEMIGGHGAAMFPFGYFMAGALLCEMAQYTWNIAELGLQEAVHKIEGRLEGGFPLAPLYGMDDTPGAAAIPEMKVETRIEASASPEKIEKLAKLAAARCPAHQSLVKGLTYKNAVSLNGERLAAFEEG